MSQHLVNKWISAVAVLWLSACASQPENIPTSYVSPFQYRDYDCEQLAAEAGRLNRKVYQLQGNLEQTASDDEALMGVGLFLFWPAIFFIEGDDGFQAQEYARLKGERDAIQKAVIYNKCSGVTRWVMPEDHIEVGSTEERLIRLDKLLSEGLLTEEEAALKRKEILDDL